MFGAGLKAVWGLAFRRTTFKGFRVKLCPDGLQYAEMRCLDFVSVTCSVNVLMMYAVLNQLDPLG